MKNRALTAMYEGLMVAAAQYVAERQPAATKPEEVVTILRPLAKEAVQENFWVLMLDARNRVTKVHLASVGLIDRAQVHAREVFREAIRCNAVRIILAHNHPGQDPTPSPQDIDCTRSLVAAGKIIGIEVLDHVVLGTATPERPRDWVSFREAGLL